MASKSSDKPGRAGEKIGNGGELHQVASQPLIS